MTPNTTELIAQSDRLRELVRAEMALTAAAYGLDPYRAGAARTVPPLETPSVAFVVARAKAEARAGVRLVKFFTSNREDIVTT